jgi:hypothetical protein
MDLIRFREKIGRPEVSKGVVRRRLRLSRKHADQPGAHREHPANEFHGFSTGRCVRFAIRCVGLRTEMGPTTREKPANDGLF